MRLRSRVPGLATGDVRALLAGLPDAPRYEVLVKPLRYRRRPHLAALTEFDDRRITLQVPEPFRPFRESVAFGARRLPGKGLRFRWQSRQVYFRTPRDVLRFLYSHEWYHWYLKERLGQKSSAETACDRFALRNYQRRRVTLEDARKALKRPLRLPSASGQRQSRRPSRPRR